MVKISGLLFLIFFGIIFSSCSNSGVFSVPPSHHKGMTIFFYGSERNRFVYDDFERALIRIKKTNCNAITLVPMAFVQSKESHLISTTDRRCISESDFMDACKLVTKHQMDLVIKPHIDIGDGTVPRFQLKPERLDLWQKEYLNFITSYARIAQSVDAEIFCVGTELLALSSQKKLWEEVIDSCRDVFDGLLTYASCPQETFSIRFWDKLDIIGVNAYFPLSLKSKPLYQDYLESWGIWGAQFEQVASHWRKPIYFTEIGYMNSSLAAQFPGDFTKTGVRSEKMQADLYKAALMSTSRWNFFYGLSFWHWELDTFYPIDYTPENKDAESVLRDYWK